MARPKKTPDEKPAEVPNGSSDDPPTNTEDNKKAPVTEPKPKVKKPRGRPKLYDATAEIKGKVDKPSDESRIMELTIASLGNFKTLFGIFNNYSSQAITMIFDKSGVTIYAKNHQNNVEMKVYVDGMKCQSYYYNSDEELRVSIATNNLGPVLGKLDGKNEKITFYSTAEDSASKLYLTTKEKILSTTDIYAFNITNDHVAIEEHAIENYDMSFDLPFEFLDSKISSMIAPKPSISEFIIRKEFQNELQFTYTIENRHELVTKFTEEKINFRTTVDPDKCFEKKITLKYIKPINKLKSKDKVSFYLDNAKPTFIEFNFGEFNFKMWLK